MAETYLKAGSVGRIMVDSYYAAGLPGERMGPAGLAVRYIEVEADSRY